MRQNHIALAAAAVLLTGCVTGCSSAQQSSQTPISTTAESSVLFDSDRELIDRSLVSLGNTSRIRAAMDRAKTGNATIGFIGGSITEGMTAGGRD